MGLIILSVLVIDIFDTSNLLNPAAPKSSEPGRKVPTPQTLLNGSLVISVVSNQNTTDASAPPAYNFTDAAGVPVLVAVGATTIPTDHWTTNAQGLTGCIKCLEAGPYAVTILYDGLNMTIPVSVFSGNQTLVMVNITGSVYPLVYSKESGVLVTPSAAQYTMFAQVTSSVPVASVGQPVILTLSGVAPNGVGYSVNATVVSLGAPTTGTQWLQLGIPSPLDLAGTPNVSMTAWTSSSVTTTGPVTYTADELQPQGSTQSSQSSQSGT